MAKDETIHIAVLEGTPDEAEFIATGLRNAGHAVRPFVIRGVKDMVDALAQSRIDLIYCDTGATDMAELCRVAQNHADQIPVIAVATGVDIEALVAAMEKGAYDLIMRNQADHLRLVTERALAAVRGRRGMRRCREAYEESEKRCRNLLDSSRDAIAYIRDGMHVYSNNVYVGMFGLDSGDDLEGMPILDLIAEEERGRFKAFLSARPDANKDRMDILCRRDDDTEFSAAMEFSPASVDGEQCTQVIIRDKSMDETVINELQALRSQDSATGLYNRQTFIDELEQAIADVKSGKQPAVVFYIDIDRFAEIRNTMGIGNIDAVVSAVGKIIAANLADDDFGARFGDHVFTVLVRDNATKAIGDKAERLIKALNTIVAAGEHSMQITASLGMAAIHGNATTPYEVLAFADAACNAAKQRGGNAFVSYKDPAKQAEEQETQEDLRRINMLQQALKKNLFTLHFQPIAALAGKGEEIYEALLRLTNEEGEVTETPAEYLLAAERTGMIILIDRWVISRAMHILADKQRRGGNTNLCVKLSGSAYSDETLLPWLYERAQASKVEVSRLIFEIAEHDITAHINQVAAFSRALKKMRCRVMISHFGTQEAPFKLFKTVPVDIIKFHPQLTDAAGADPAAAAKLRNMVAAARQLNKPTIASQIESAAGMAALFQCGVDMAQGGFIHEPEAEMRFDFSGEM